MAFKLKCPDVSDGTGCSFVGAVLFWTWMLPGEMGLTALALATLHAVGESVTQRAIPALFLVTAVPVLGLL